MFAVTVGTAASERWASECLSGHKQSACVHFPEHLSVLLVAAAAPVAVAKFTWLRCISGSAVPSASVRRHVTDAEEEEE